MRHQNLEEVLFAFGTRPEALKMIPVIEEVRDRGVFRPRLLLTGQHREMLDQVLRIFKIKPDDNLDLMTEDQTLPRLSARVLGDVSEILRKRRPSIVIVQGDTTTAFSVSLSAFYEKIPVAHIEAGLRTQNKYHPFPEEINRRLISQIADLHFAPTEEAQRNLWREGIPKGKIHVTGNTIVDTLRKVERRLERSYPVFKNVDFSHRTLLVTAHRRENFGKPLQEICLAIKDLVERLNDIQVIYPVHLNPNVQGTAKGILRAIPRVFLIDPLNYEEMVFLLKRSTLVLTDSGGIQEEAPCFGKPVLVLREVSERPEGIKNGIAKVVGTDRERIVKEALRLLCSKGAYEKMAHAGSLYGDGRASQRIAGILEKSFRISDGKGRKRGQAPKVPVPFSILF